jgi:hypothetical protein
MTLKRASGWLARQLIRVATRIAPHAREEWAQAMTREVDATPGPRDALSWAFGCLQVSCHEWLKSMRLTNLWPVRWGMALWIALLAIDTLWYAGITLAYKLGFYSLSEHWNVPLLKVTPLWEPIATLAIGVTFILAIVLILKRSRAALEAITTPFVLMLVLVAIRFSRPESGDLQSLSIAYERSHFVLIWPVAGLILTILMCWALWHDRQPSAPR